MTSIERLAGHVPVRGRIFFRVEVSQPHFDSESSQAATERAVAAARIESDPRQFD